MKRYVQYVLENPGVPNRNFNIAAVIVCLEDLNAQNISKLAIHTGDMAYIWPAPTFKPILKY